MHINSKIVGHEWESAASRRMADRLVRDVLGDYRRFTRAVKYNDKALAASRPTEALILERPYIEAKLSREEIDRKIQQHGDVPKNQDSLLHLLTHDVFLPMAEALCEEYPEYVFERGGLILYRQGNYMGWHTNSTNPVNRIYFSYSDTGDSGFVYYDHANDRVHDDRDQTGWNIREFEAGDGVNEPLYWHGVYSYCNRISIGFRVKSAARVPAWDSGPALEGEHRFEAEWGQGFQLTSLPPGKRYSVPIRSLQYLLTPDRLRDCSFTDIAYRPSSDKSSPAYRACDPSLPGIVARGMPNPEGKPFRLIDGTKRLQKSIERREVRGKFYVLTASEVMRHLVVQDTPGS